MQRPSAINIEHQLHDRNIISGSEIMASEIVFCTKRYLVIIYIFEAGDSGISSCIFF